jgi:hypothetical protein
MDAGNSSETPARRRPVAMMRETARSGRKEAADRRGRAPRVALTGAQFARAALLLAAGLACAASLHAGTAKAAFQAAPADVQPS